MWQTLKAWWAAHLVGVGLWLAQHGGWAPVCNRLHLPDTPLLDHARHIVSHVEGKFYTQNGAFKAREALRMLANHYPHARTRDLQFLIEAALQ